MFVLVVVVFPQYTTKTSPSFSVGIVGRGKYTNAHENGTWITSGFLRSARELRNIKMFLSNKERKNAYGQAIKH